MSDEKSLDMNRRITEGVIWKQLLIFFFPIMLGSFFQQLYNTVDTIIVGQFVGTVALAAVGGSAAQVVNLIVGFFTGISTGASVVITHHYGAEDEKGIFNAAHTAYAIALAGGLVLSLIGIFATPFLIHRMNTPEEVVPDSILYLRVFFAGMVFVFVYNMGSSILRASGDSKNPLLYLIVCCFVNIILDIFFVLGMGLGVFGAAFATLIAQATSAILVTRKLVKMKGILYLRPRRIRFHKTSFIQQMKIGLPGGFESTTFAITNIAIQASINAFGTETVAAWSAFGKVDAIYWMMSIAFGTSITVFVGQNYGAGKIDRVHKSTWVCMGMDFGISAVMVIVLILFRNFLFSLFTSDPDVIKIGSHMLIMIAPMYLVYVIIEVLNGMFRGVGDVLIPAVMTIFGICILRIIWLVFVMKEMPSIDGIVYSYPISWIFTALFFVIYYFARYRRKKETA